MAVYDNGADVAKEAAFGTIEKTLKARFFFHCSFIGARFSRK